MQRIIIDTSTLVSVVLHAGSTPHKGWLKAQQNCAILACPATLAELETVLHREYLFRYIDPATRDQFLRLFRATIEMIDVTEADQAAVKPPCRDPKDNIFLAVASLGMADLIISSDHDLLVLHPWNGIPILTPAQFLAESEY